MGEQFYLRLIDFLPPYRQFYLPRYKAGILSRRLTSARLSSISLRMRLSVTLTPFPVLCLAFLKLALCRFISVTAALFNFILISPNASPQSFMR